MAASLITLSHSLIDWSKPGLTLEEAESRLLSWDRSYLPELADKYRVPRLSIARALLRRSINREKNTGRHELWQYLVDYILLLFPSTRVTPALCDMAKGVQCVRDNRRHILNLIGSASSGKSAFQARALIALVSCDPEYSVAFLAAPYKNVADYTIWSELMSCYQEAKTENPTFTKLWKTHKSENRISFGVVHPKAGSIRLLGVDDAGKLQGTKARDGSRGLLIVDTDEIALYHSQAYMDIIANVNKNRNFFGMTGCNFRNTASMEGRLCEPEGRSYKDLNPDVDQFWESHYNSVTLRSDGHLSPNVLAGRAIYPFLLTEDSRSEMERTYRSPNHPKYLEQIRSFPYAGQSDYLILNDQQIVSSGAYLDFRTENMGQKKRVAFCDPGFTGDPAVVCVSEFGLARSLTSSGKYRALDILYPLKQHTIPLDVTLVADEAWKEKLRKVGAEVWFNPGQKVTLETQIAVECAQICLEYRVPFNHFGFDGSMRAAVSQEFYRIMGPQVIGVDFGAQATDRLTALGTEAKKEYVNLVTEMWFAVQVLVLNGQLRNGGEIEEALKQFCRRTWEPRGARKILQDKEKFKGPNFGKSPDEGDAFAGSVEVARRKGFSLDPSKRPSGPATGKRLEDLKRLIPGLRPFHRPKLCAHN